MDTRGCADASERCVDVLLFVRLLLKFGLGGRAPDLICRSATYDVFSSTSSSLSEFSVVNNL